MDKKSYRVYAVKNSQKKQQNPGDGGSQACQSGVPGPKPSLFHILPTDNPSHPHEFFITYIGEEELRKETNDVTGSSAEGKESKEENYRKIHRTPRYLTAPTNWRGFYGDLLELKFNGRSANASFTLVNRVMRLSHGVSTAPWISHHDTYFIRCNTKPFAKHSYLAVVQQCDPTTMKKEGATRRDKKPIRQVLSDLFREKGKQRDEEKRARDPWLMRCMPSKAQEDREDVSMLFRLLPKYYLKHTEQNVHTKSSDHSEGDQNEVRNNGGLNEVECEEEDDQCETADRIETGSNGGQSEISHEDDLRRVEADQSETRIEDKTVNENEQRPLGSEDDQSETSDEDEAGTKYPPSLLENVDGQKETGINNGQNEVGATNDCHETGNQGETGSENDHIQISSKDDKRTPGSENDQGETSDTPPNGKARSQPCLLM